MNMGTWKRVRTATVISVALALTLAMAAVAGAQTGAELAGKFLAKTPITAFDGTMTVDRAAKGQAEFIAAISREFGEPVGYKAGLTSEKAQKAFGVSQPVRGTLLSKMLLPNGAILPARFGCISLIEGDLIVRVGDEAINTAKTPAETLKSLDAVIPFMELPDGVFDKNVKLTVAAVIAINVGARYGVMGTPIPLAATPEWQARLRNFTFQLTDEKGGIVGEGKGEALLGDPLNAVLWIKDSLAAEGKKLKKGDLLSLGSLTRPIVAKPGTAFKARYLGLDPKGPVEVSVSFK